TAQVGAAVLLVGAGGDGETVEGGERLETALAQPAGLFQPSRDLFDRLAGKLLGGRFDHPTEPSISSAISRFISTAYSIGSSFTIGSMNPLTIIVVASGVDRPRLCR